MPKPMKVSSVEAVLRAAVNLSVYAQCLQHQKTALALATKALLANCILKPWSNG